MVADPRNDDAFARLVDFEMKTELLPRLSAVFEVGPRLKSLPLEDVGAMLGEARFLFGLFALRHREGKAALRVKIPKKVR